MIYHLFELIGDLDFPGHGLMNYLSVRALLAGLTALLVALLAGGRIIRTLQRRSIGETVRDLGLEGEYQKAGTPTMGGIIILLATLSGALLFCRLTSIYTILLIATTLVLGGLGFLDDYIKVFRHDKNGVSEKGKLAVQILLGFAVALTVCLHPDIDTTRLQTTLPFIKNHEFNYSWLSPFSGQLGVYCTWGIYVAMIVLVLTACSNSVNLTDGMDGLAGGTSAIAGVALGVLAWVSGHSLAADYLNIQFVPGSGEVAVYLAALVGALVGFLWYNCYPARVFMGDTGSLAIGGILGMAAILIRKELLLPLLCGVFFAESLSVILQRSYFRRTKAKYGEGRRIFKMSPLHHHFQKEGIPALIQSPRRAHPEPRIVTRFWIVAILLAAGTLALLKLR